MSRSYDAVVIGGGHNGSVAACYLRGLYLCGSGAWPGGCVMGAPGHNAAQEVITRVRAGRA